MIDKSSKNPLSKVNVLVVDNDVKLVRLVTNILEAFGFQDIETAEDGVEAYAKLEEKKYDVILLDWSMQPMDGIEFVKKLRNDETNKSIFAQVIMLSGRAEREHILEARDAGVTEFMAKPFSIAGFRERIISVIESPREFVISDEYSGPSRRRRAVTPPTGQDRREV